MTERPELVGERAGQRGCANHCVIKTVQKRIPPTPFLLLHHIIPKQQCTYGQTGIGPPHGRCAQHTLNGRWPNVGKQIRQDHERQSTALGNPSQITRCGKQQRVDTALTEVIGVSIANKNGPKTGEPLPELGVVVVEEGWGWSVFTGSAG